MDTLTAARVLIDVALTQSFTATAERLEMSRPMVTRHVEALENWLGVRLLQRTTRKVSLTSAGEQSLPQLEQWVEQANALTQQWQQDAGLTGKVRVATSMSFGFAQLIPAVKPFMAAHPGVDVDIEVQDKAVDLIAERIDIAIRIASNPDPSLIGRPIAACDSVLVAAPDYLAAHAPIRSPEDLTAHSCLSYKQFDRPIWHLDKDEEHAAVEVQGKLSANEATTLLSAAIQGMGVSMQPVYLAHSAIARGQLEVVLPDWQPKAMDIYALYPSRRNQPPAVRALLDALIAHFADSEWAPVTI
ncbi:LysR family transcriptional regulator [Salinivibrio kushneri]|uniref:LysR family transcriptional regulator n=1 Tax=Salinivibrio kushneri TaxID=1908198 RepID=UPI0009891AAE|nr:LysR family transcriptional regulator [Salinivibrio kushneri]OOE64548.1 LysR family transcriptional regulator [Salinivibrio kushneri]